jgi:hypothetical protein
MPPGGWTRPGRYSKLDFVSISPWSSAHDRTVVIAGAVAPFVVAAVLAPFRSGFPNTDAALLLVAVIVAVAAHGHRGGGLLAAVSAAAWFDFFLTRPYERFAITRWADVQTTLLLLLVGAAVTELAVHARRQRTIAAADTAYLDAIGAVLDLVGSGAAPRAVIERVTVEMLSLFGLRGCRFERLESGDLPRLEEDGRLSVDGRDWDVDRRGMPSVPVEVVARYRGASYGRFVLSPAPGSMSAPVARRVAVALVSQVGVALSGSA